MKSLTELQSESIDSILALPEQGRRAAGYGLTLLNKLPRSLRAIRNGYERQAARMGFEACQIEQQWNDVKDMAKLEANAE